jgi:hypothetical protein
MDLASTLTAHLSSSFFSVEIPFAVKWKPVGLEESPTALEIALWRGLSFAFMSRFNVGVKRKVEVDRIH